MSRLLLFIEDLIYSFSCWLQSKSEVFNLFFSFFFTVFFLGMTFIMLMLPQMKHS